MEGTTSSSNKESFRSESSPKFSKMSGHGGTGRMGHQHRNSNTTEADRVERLEPEESHSCTLPLSTETNKSMPDMVPYRKLLSFATSFDYILMAIGALAAVTHGAILPVTVSLLGRVVHALGSDQSKRDLAYQKICQISLILVYIAVASIVISWLEVGCWMYAGERQALKIRTRYLEALLSQKMTFFDTEISSEDEIMNRLSRDMLLIHEAIGVKVCGFIFKVTVFAVGVTVAFLETWQVALLTCCTLSLLSGIAVTCGRICTRLLIRAQASTAKSGSIAGEAITQIRTVYSLVAESWALAAFSKALQATAKLGIQAGLAKGVEEGFSLGFMNLSWALALWYGGFQFRKGKVDGGALLAAVFNVIFGGMTLGRAFPDLQVFRQGRVAAVKVFEVINCQRDDNLIGQILATVRGEIQFQNVNFSYPSCQDIPIFSELSLTIHAGETVALVGSGGSGKSSLLMLLQRFYSINSGVVTLDGKNIEELQLNWFRLQIGFVSQEPVLLSGTIRQNILLGNLEASEAEVEAAAKDAKIHSFICNLPNGYETLVGESGIQLSRGQRHLLAITRAIVRKPAIYLLDEATSALDAQSEQTLLHSLHSAVQGCTIVVVACQLSTLQNADVIAVLDHGRVVERGSHAQLLEQSDRSWYASFVRLQENSQGRGDGLETSVMATKVSTTMSNSLPGSPPRSSFYSGATSPLASLFQSPMTPSTPNTTLESQSNSYPTSPFILELPPSPVTPSMFSRENSKVDADYLLEKERDVMQNSSNLRYWSICQLSGPEWLSIFLGSIAAVVTGCLNPLLILYLTDAIELFYSPHDQQEKTGHKVNLWCTVIAGLGLVNISCSIIQHFFYSKAGENTSNFLCEKVFKAVLRNEVGWFDSDDHSSSVLTSTVASCGITVKVAIKDRTPSCIHCFAALGVAITLAFTIQWKLAAATMILIPFTAIGGSFQSHFLKKGFAGDLEKSHEVATHLAAEAVLNIHTVAAFCLEQQTVNRFRHSLEVPLRQVGWRAHKGGLLYGISQAGMHASDALCLWYMALQVNRHQADFGSALKVYQLLAWIGFLLAGIMRHLKDIQKGMDAIVSLLDISNHKTEIDADPSDGLKLADIAGKVEFQHVTFYYPNRPTAVVLSDFNLSISQGQTVALVGSKGCGKSTILNLVERFYDPTSGIVLLDGFNIQTLNLKWLRKQMSLVQQEPVLFTLSIRENIQCGKENSTETEVIEAARKANAHGFISGLPRGYATSVGDQLTQLSRGQMQRVAIARAVIREPKIFLLDEATGDLDAQSEKVVQDALDNIMLEERRTTIVIAHRLPSIQCADLIVFINNGHIKERGSHSMLMAMHGEYAKLFHLQSTA
ncbi:unnamed protein product [Calypogeia fissa]